MSNYGFLETGSMMEGILLMRPVDSVDPYLDLGNCTMFTTGVSTKTTERISMRKGTSGLPLDSLAKIDKVTATLEVDTINRQTYALATMGRDTDFTQAAIVDQVATVTLSDTGWTRLPHFKINDVRIAGATEGVDYEVLADSGLVKLRKGGALAPGSRQVTYTAAYIDGYQVEAGVMPAVTRELLFDGVNLFNDSPAILEVPRALLAPSGEINWIGDKANSVKFSLTFLMAQGKSAPYTMKIFPREAQTPPTTTTTSTTTTTV